MRTQLNDACAPNSIGDGAGSGISQHATRVAYVRIRVRPVNVVEHIKHVRPDFEFQELANRELFCETEVYVCETRPHQSIASVAAKGPRRRVGKGRRVEPLLVRRIRQFRVTNQLGIQRRASVEGGSQTRIKTVRNRTLDHGGERNSSMPLEKTG